MPWEMEGNLYWDAIKAQCYLKHCPEKTAEEARRICKEIWDGIGQGRVSQGPKFLMLKVTGGCNSDCSYCAYSASQAKYRRQGDISLGSIQSIARQAGELGVVAVGINGGEPLIRRDFPEIVKAFVGQGVAPILMTNGLWLPRYWDELGACGLNYIVISFDSLKKEHYELHRGAKLEEALAGIEAAVAMRRKYKDVIIHVTAVLTRHNAQDMEELVEFMSGQGIWVEIGAYQHQEFQQEDTMSMEVRREAEELIQKLLRMKREGYLVSNSEEYLSHIPDFFLEGKKTPNNYECLVGQSILFVDDYLNVKPCSSPELHVVGNLEHQRLKDIWGCGRMEGYRARMRKADCGGCWYLCNEVSSFFRGARL